VADSDFGFAKEVLSTTPASASDAREEFGGPERVEVEGVAKASEHLKRWLEDIRTMSAAGAHVPMFFETVGECLAALEEAAPEYYED